MIDVRETDSSGLQAIINGVKGKLPRGKRNRPLSVFDVSESFFLRGCNQLTVLHERCRRIMKNGVNSECVHQSPLATASRRLAFSLRSSRTESTMSSGSTSLRQSWCCSGQMLL